MRGATIGAFAATLVAGVAAMFVGVIVTAGLSSSMSAGEAGDALMWFGGAELLGVVACVAAFAALARRWGGATPPWWALGLLGLLLLGAAAVLFLFGMVVMNR